MAAYRASIIEHYCSGGPEECGGIVLSRQGSLSLLRRIKVEVLPGKYRVFDTLEAAQSYFAKYGDAVVMDAG